jgi:site-specific recombinase
MITTGAVARVAIMLTAMIAQMVAGRISFPLLILTVSAHYCRPYILAPAILALVIESYFIAGPHVWFTAICSALSIWLWESGK